jgi:peptide/nickel transport system substrate-binding protein
MERWRPILVRSVVVPVLLLGCAAPPSPRAADPGAAAPQQAAVFKRITVAIRGAAVALSQRQTQRVVGGVAGLDALEDLVHSGLTHADPQGGRHAKLAEAVPTVENGLWKVLPDGRMETIWQLRPSAAWHDGMPLTSGDLLFTTTVEQDRDVGMPRNPVFDLIERIEAPDARTIVVTWRQPYIEADALFGHDVAIPMPRHLLEGAFAEDKSAFFAAPYWNVEYVGAGPFKVRDWVADSHVVLQANDAYVLGRPKIDEIEARFIPDPNTVVANLLAGTVDLTVGRGPSFEQAQQLLDQWRDGGVVFRPGGWIVITPQLLNPTPAIVGDVRFRRALLHAADRQEMADTLMAGQSSIGHSFVGPDEADHQALQASIAKYEYDPRRAVRMIEELGFVRGADGLFADAGNQRLSVEISTTVQNDTHLKAMPATADYWKAAGVIVEQVPIPLQRIQDREYRATFPSFTLGLISISLSPGDVSRYHSAATPLPENRFVVSGNTARYRSPELDSYIDRYVTTIPKDQRLQMLMQIVRHQSENVTALGLFHYVNPTMVANRVLNVGGRGAKAMETWNAQLWDVR